MADKMTKTTSSISLDKQPVNMTKTTSPPMPNRGEALLVTRLAENITDSYRMVKQKQQKFNDLTNQQHHHQPIKRTNNNDSSNNTKLIKPILKTPTDEWQEVCSPKNKLKRKKTLSASLTSVTDSVNQEKRTRIEGMQLNCRGRLHIKENIQNSAPTTPTTVNPTATPVPSRTERLAGKPPLPPSSKQTNTESKALVNPPPRLKRKLQENVQTIQKLNALTEQLRLEINELKSSLTTEKGAVRVLRAQNESEARKWKTEVKKLQNAVELLKKAGANKKCDTASTNNENLPQAAMGGLVNYEIQRLTNEINTLKEANKALEEKKVINCDADRRKAADIRELKDSYEIRLTQIQKSAKNEISRLLEEIKTKERNIGQLKKDLQILQNSKTTSRNATTNNTNLTNKTTNSNAKINQNNKKPKSSPTNAANNKQNEESSKDKESSKDTTTTATTKNKDLIKKAENSEISKLKNIELINNTKNVTTNLQKSTKILNTQHHNNNNNNAKETEIVENNNDQNTITIIHKHLKALEIPDLHNHNNSNNNNNNDHNDNDGHNCCMNLLHKKHEPLLLTTATQTTDTSSLINSTRNMTATATATTQTPNTPLTTATLMSTSIAAAAAAAAACDETDHFDEQHITQELTQHLQNKAIQDAKENHNHDHDHRHHHRHHHHHHHHHHNNHSDSDSALSSAPTSISPQPPANGEEPTDLWQTMRSYTHDIEKLQKEVDLLQKQNEHLKQELNIAKDQIIELETNAMESANNSKIPQLMERIKYLEDQEHELQAEANDLREQNELLEFRILELEETNDKWSLQSNTNPTSDTSESMQTTTVANNTQNLWSCPSNSNNSCKPDPFEMLFGNNSHTSQNTHSIQLDSGIISPQSQHHHDDLIDISNEELCRRLGDLLKKSSLEEDERHCLQQVLNLVQQLDALTPRSGPNSLNSTSSSDEASSLDLVKSRISDYSSASSASTTSGRSTYDNSSVNSTKGNNSNSSNSTTPSRIVATVQPYNSTAPYIPSNSHQLAPNNTPTDSPRKARCQPWQTSSLSESGVFVESDFYSDSSENNVCTQTDFEDVGGISAYSTHHIFNSPTKKVPVQQQNSSSLTDQKRLQYYKERVEVLEGKVLIYESSGDVQAKRLAERLQREILLEKEVNELRDRVEFLESENSSLEEEKCEFEEAENDTRLRLQRLEVELEILSQRNIELEMSREALSAKYKDCHSECLILRDDLATSETQIRHLEEDKQKAKENLEFLHNTLPLLLVCNTYYTLAQVQNQNETMGNQGSNMNLSNSPTRFSAGGFEKEFLKSSETCICQERELQYLKEEVKCLRHQIKDLNTRHYAAMESADSHWVDLEREYKEREEQCRAKEMCLKQKIQQLQDCLREDARSANEKICQLEEAEQGLKTCLVRVSKDHQKLQEDHQLMVSEFERFKEQHEQVREQQKPLTEALESEKRRNKGLIDELTFMRKLQQETESQAKKELESVRGQMFDLKKDFLHIEVTNGELREEVATLELQIQNLEKEQRESEEKIRCLTDEIRTKDEICQKLEKRLERSEGYSLADELGDSPSKRFKREDVKDLKSASKGLGQALRHMGDCERMLPTQKQFKTIARDVKKLADTLLQGDAPEEENKFCCDRSTCPKRQQLKDESSIQSSSLEGMDKKANKETQMSASITSSSSERNSVPEKTCEKSSEAYFDRNNQNISCCHSKFCPSNSSQTSQTESNMCAPIPTQVNRPLCCIKCKRSPQSIYNTTNTSSLPETIKHKCSYKQLDITSSSSSSITSEHFPVKLSLKSNSMEYKMPLPKIRQLTQQIKPIFVSSTAPREERLPPLNSTNYKTSNCEQYYSCSSENSESESSEPTKLQRSRKCCKTNKNCAILELLHEVVHLINKDNSKRDEALDDKSSKTTLQEMKIKIECKPKDLKPPTTTEFAPLTWPPPCLCCAYGIALGQGQPFNMPVIQPYNLMSPAATASQIPEPFVFEETDDSFRDCSSGNKSLIADKIPDKLCCICCNIIDICSKHGSLMKMLKKTDNELDQTTKPTVAQQSSIGKPEIKTKPHSSDEDVDEELHPSYVKMKAYDPQQDYTINVKREIVDDDEEPRWEGKPDILLTPIELEEDIDEELHPRYVDKMCVDSPDNNEPSPDCLLVYDDEEPKQAEDIVDVDEEIQPIFVEQNPLENYEPSPDCLMEYDDEDRSWPDITNTVNDLQPIEDHVISSEIVVPQPPEDTLDNKSNAELDKSSHHTIHDTTETLQVTEHERSPYIVETSPTTGRNVYNFLPEIDRAAVGNPKQIIRYNESEEDFDSYYREEESVSLGDEEYELAKEKRAESRKKKKPDADEITSTALAPIKQLEGEGSPQEMKFFIDTLIMDFEAMEYARRKSQFEKNICKTKAGLCARASFPVTITDVTDLGANSLYVKWSIHDCCGIGGYEIYTDGYLTNRYYNSRHEAAVITQVDVTLPHKVALVAQPTADDENLELMCNITKAKNKPKCLPWKTDVENEQKSWAALWTPSIFLYDPDTCKATVAPPIMRDNF